MPRTILDIHIIQSVPPSNLNRDDTGSPKSAIYGGVRRARVSSQAWKRSTRLAFNDLLDVTDLGVRTKRVVELVAAGIREQAPDLAEQADKVALEALKAAGFKLKPPRKGEQEVPDYLLFLSRQQIANLAAAAVESARSGAALDKGTARKIVDADHSVDVALFGRMVADATDLNVDASVQVAHAISVHAAEAEFDYFTAVDDRAPEDNVGAGMIGTVEFNSATLYRFATVDVDALTQNLGDREATARAVAAFVRAFTTSMPTGKQTTFANRTLPDAVVVSARDTQPVSYVGAFEEPVVAHGSSGLVRTACQRLAAYAKDVQDAYEMAPLATWVVRLGDRAMALDGLGKLVPLDALVAGVGELVRERAEESS